LREVSRHQDGPLTVDATRVAIQMLVLAWFPSVHCKLRFGTQDQTEEWLRRARLYAEDVGDPFDASAYVDPSGALTRFVESSPIVVNEMMRYVPYRVLTPFFSLQLRGLHDYQKDSRIRELCEVGYEEDVVPYAFDNGTRGLAFRMNPRWVAYFREHHGILRDWCLWHWSRYMQARNPSSPNIPGRLLRPERRKSLRAQREFWKRAFERKSIHCPYSGRPLSSEDYELDHVLPWTFLAHDELWNLVPSSPVANASKGNWLPHPDYISSLAAVHSQTLATERGMNRKDWNEVWAVYVDGLKLESDLDVASDGDFQRGVREAYGRVLRPLIELAASQGFQSEWRWGAEGRR
jgi:hypothetical protein